MEQLTWTGSLAFLNPVMLTLVAVFAVAAVAQIILSFFAADEIRGVNPDGTLMARGGTLGMVEKVVTWSFLAWS